MAGQLERSIARKKLTRICADAIIEIIQTKTNVQTSKKKLFEAYLSASRIVLGISVETLTKQTIPIKLTEKGRVLSLFNSEIDYE
ncbi:MAG: hypothetical protein ACJZ46_01805 [Candidatus Thalassarchaeaceae archaeon]